MENLVVDNASVHNALECLEIFFSSNCILRYQVLASIKKVEGLCELHGVHLGGVLYFKVSMKLFNKIL